MWFNFFQPHRHIDFVRTFAAKYEQFGITENFRFSYTLKRYIYLKPFCVFSLFL